MSTDFVRPISGVVKPVSDGSSVPDFAERVLEGAPIFAAILAKAMADKTAEAPQAEDREKAHKLKELARENTEKMRRVLPIESP